VHGLPVRKDAASVADNIGIYPRFTDVAVKHLAPGATAGNADALVETVKGGEMHDHEHVVAFAFDPAMERQHA
jgi:hypothetical protein